MDLIPKVSIRSLSIGDILTGQDGNKYIVCKEANIMYWKPHVVNTTNDTTVMVAKQPKMTPTQPKPVKNVKEVKEKYYWKDNNKKPEYNGDNYSQMVETLKPKVSPTKFPLGYVWTTKFRNISFVVDYEYKGYSKTQTRYWNVVVVCPPCLDAEDYPYKYYTNEYFVDYDEKGNKFWSDCYYYNDFDGYCVDFPFIYASKFPFEHVYTNLDGSKHKRIVDRNGEAKWDNI